MHLSSLHLANFRSFASETVLFEKLLTVLVGENNGGKSNVIDAVRLVSAPLNGRRELYCEPTDIRFGVAQQHFELQATFEELSPSQQGRLLSATTDDTLQQARFGVTYDASLRKSHIRPTLWAGRFKAPPEAGCHEMIRHVYLPPLRDAKRALASGNPTRIHALLNHFLGERDPEDVAKELARTREHKILNDVDDAVGTGLQVLTSGVRPQDAALGFNSDEKLIDIARDLRFKLADHGIVPEDLRYSGHGFANLLYIATIAVELERTDDAELTLFLVEEPEAHLHPQLQAAVLNFLQEQAARSLEPKVDDNAPAGLIQVIVATHSPNLSAWVPGRSLVCIRSILPMNEENENGEKLGKKEANEPAESPVDLLSPGRRMSRCIPLAKLDLSNRERSKIDRYLDVTKSALLFGGRVLLVEGIAEALLLPVIAKHHVLQDRPDALRVFRSAVFVPIDGVDFAPYVKVLISPYNGVRVADRLVVLTDGDEQTEYEGDESPGQRRRAALLGVASVMGAREIVDVSVGAFSLETELVVAGNAELMKAVYLSFHSRSEAKWDCALSMEGDTLGKAVQDLFQTTPKGDFAQRLAEKIAEGAKFEVPGYIRHAIEALVE